MYVNKSGIYAIQAWIDSNQDKNPSVSCLWANGVASEIDQCATLEQDITVSGRFEYETGLRDARGRMLSITLEREHINTQMFQ